MTDDPVIARRYLGRTGLHVSRLALGTVELGLDYGIQSGADFGRPSEKDAISLVHCAVDLGINLLDTARAYGASESVLGKALRSRRERVVLATKAITQGVGDQPLDDGALRRQMRQSLETSLRALQTDYVDIWQVHHVDTATLARIELIADIFSDVKKAGLVRWSGGSFYGADIPLAALSSDVFDVMQVTYSVLDQRLADYFLPQAKSRNIGVIARSVLLKGVLTERAEHLPDRLHLLRTRSRRFRQLAQQYCPGHSPAQLAIAFALANRQIDTVLVGVRTSAELQDNLESFRLQLDTDLMALLSVLRLEDAELLNPATWGIP